MPSDSRLHKLSGRSDVIRLSSACGLHPSIPRCWYLADYKLMHTGKRQADPGSATREQASTLVSVEHGNL